MNLSFNNIPRFFIETAGLDKAVDFFKHPRTKMAVLVTGAILFFITSFLLGLAYKQVAGHNESVTYLKHQINEIDKTKDHQGRIEKLTALSQFSESELGYFPAELKYRLLLTHWQAALNSFEKLMSAENNNYLKKDNTQILSKVQDSLIELKNLCTDSIQDLKSAEKPETLWKIFNLRGCGSVLLAFTMVELEEDTDKSKSLLEDAIKDYKEAIRLVDATSLSCRDRLSPRWNMELMTGRGKLRQISKQHFQQQDARKLFKQLEVVKPDELGGYDPGTPMETKVKK